ncbi:MAG: putative hydro-lyase [Proteobacteria bacterium]|nr:putative hydro-lyase [Pseudomonadota bacterium]
MNASRLLRDRIRAGEHTTVTTGLAPGHLQANLVVLPADWADEFAAFCAANPKPCPLIARSASGDPSLPELGPDIDVRRDLPRYRVFRDGKAVSEETDIGTLWRDDLVAFALGCSYSFESALLAAGVPIRHMEQGKKVCTYRTGLGTVPAGRLHGRMVVSMRNFTVPNAIRAIEITSRFPRVHGAPIHFGDPGAIGIADIDKPEYGGEPDIRAGEVPLFWACGVTPQAVIEAARPPFCITHKAGHMLVTDRLNEEFREA